MALLADYEIQRTAQPTVGREIIMDKKKECGTCQAFVLHEGYGIGEDNQNQGSCRLHAPVMRSIGYGMSAGGWPSVNSDTTACLERVGQKQEDDGEFDAPVLEKLLPEDKLLLAQVNAMVKQELNDELEQYYKDIGDPNGGMERARLRICKRNMMRSDAEKLQYTIQRALWRKYQKT
jgi:hypothetical protein